MSEQKVALITGSARSIGAAIAQRLAAAGYAVTINYVSPSSASIAQSLADSINAQGKGQAVPIQANVSSEAGAKQLVEGAAKAFGTSRVDVVVANAGVLDPITLEGVSEEAYARSFDINVKGPLFLVKEAAKYMKPGGRVIFLSSTLAHASSVQPNQLLYCATKGAVEQLTRILAKELGARGITVNSVAPGPVETPMFFEGKSEAVISAITNLAPSKRLGTVDDIAPVVAFLAGEESRWVNGQTILANGGYAV